MRLQCSVYVKVKAPDTINNTLGTKDESPNMVLLTKSSPNSIWVCTQTANKVITKINL